MYSPNLSSLLVAILISNSIRKLEDTPVMMSFKGSIGLELEHHPIAEPPVTR
jgi:hypothetical protein